MRRPITRHFAAPWLLALDLAIWAIVLLLLLSAARPAGAIMTAYSLPGSAGGGECNTGNDQELFAQNTADGVYGLTYDRMVAIEWTGSGTVTEYIITLSNIAGTGNLSVGMYTDSAGKPDTQVAGLTKTLPSTSLVNGANSFTLDAPAAAAGTWIVVIPTDTLTCDIARHSVSVISNKYNYTTTGWTDWQSSDVDRELKITVMGCP